MCRIDRARACCEDRYCRPCHRTNRRRGRCERPQDRDRVRKWVTTHGRPTDFIEVFVDTPLDVCEDRDPKGLYKQAREGKIPHFTGISDPYEPPTSPELHLEGGTVPADQMAARVFDYLVSAGIVPAPDANASDRIR